MTEAFVVKNLSFRYSEKNDYVIKDLSLKIYKNQTICIVGENGSGKTTFVKLLAGILTPTEGSIQKAFEYSAFVFQNPENQFVSNIVEEDVAFGPENLCYSSEVIRNLVDSSLQKVGMSDFKDRLISTLSTGEKQRVAFAGAIALSSECIILDEPACELPTDRKNTVICVTQDINTALKADRILVMKDGKIIADNSPAEFVADTHGLLIPENIKLVQMLNAKGLHIKDYSPEGIVEEISKRC